MTSVSISRVRKAGQQLDIYGPARAVKGLSRGKTRFRTDAVIYPTSLWRCHLPSGPDEICTSPPQQCLGLKGRVKFQGLGKPVWPIVSSTRSHLASYGRIP